MNDINHSRRRFLRNAAIVTTGGIAALNTPAALAAFVKDPVRSISLYNIHTGESGKFVYWAQGNYLGEGIATASHLLRDHRTGEVIDMDRSLLDTMYFLQQSVGSRHGFEVVSGYRSPRSNSKLRRLDGKGVAKQSFHTKGQAVDLRLPGTELVTLQKAARHLQRGGVGYYPSHRFVHLDSGWVRSWREQRS